MAKEKATSILLGLPSGGNQSQNNGFKNKWIYLSAILFLALAAAIYRLYFFEECPEIDFELSTIQNSEGAMFKFYDFTPGADTWEWDFGDNTGVSMERSPIHLFKQAGTYDVMLTINGACTRLQTITIIQESPGLQDETVAGSPMITSVDSSDISLTASSTADVPDSDPATKVATRLVPVPDPTITDNQQATNSSPITTQNVINPESNQENNSSQQSSTRQQTSTPPETLASGQEAGSSEDVGQSNVEVTESLDKSQPETVIAYIPNEAEASQQPDEAVVEYEMLTDLDIKTMVFDVSELRQLPSDVMDSFCKGSLDRTIVDANNTTMSMGDFFERIEGKPIRIKSFIVHRDPNDNNCIVGMKIKYGKVGLF